MHELRSVFRPATLKVIIVALVMLSGRAPALKKPRRFTNYAFQGARARANAPVQPLFDLATQVNGFLTDFGSVANPNRTYVIFVGGNDARDALAAQTDEVQAQMIVGAAVTAIADAAQTLWASGARSFLVMNAPNLAVAPAVRLLGEPAITAGQQISMGFNAALSGALDTLAAALPNLAINRVDIFGSLNDVVPNPGDFGIEDAENPCLTFGVIGGAVCARPHRRLFWDGIHSSSGGHRILRDTVVEALTGP
jgi:outer membrane lipase/esterase